jgi:hypothetical protein
VIDSFVKFFLPLQVQLQSGPFLKELSLVVLYFSIGFRIVFVATVLQVGFGMPSTKSKITLY